MLDGSQVNHFLELGEHHKADSLSASPTEPGTDILTAVQRVSHLFFSNPQNNYLRALMIKPDQRTIALSPSPTH